MKDELDTVNHLNIRTREFYKLLTEEALEKTHRQKLENHGVYFISDDFTNELLDEGREV